MWLNTALGSILQKPYHLLGHSWGADAALHFTRHFPLNVSELVLLDGARVKGIRQLKEAIEDTTVVSIPDSSHLLQWDHPSQLAAVIESWIAEKS